MAERTKDVWGKRTPFPASGEWPVRADEFVLEQPERWVASACVLCSNGCGIDIGVKDGRIVGVRGPPTTGSTAAGSGRRASTGGRRTTRRTG